MSNKKALEASEYLKWVAKNRSLLVACCPDCNGLFIDSETLQVQKCDECGVFESDAEAAKAVRLLLNVVKTWNVPFKVEDK